MATQSFLNMIREANIQSIVKREQQVAQAELHLENVRLETLRLQDEAEALAVAEIMTASEPITGSRLLVMDAYLNGQRIVRDAERWSAQSRARVGRIREAVASEIAALQAQAQSAAEEAAQSELRPARLAAQEWDTRLKALALARKYVDLTDTGGLYEATIVQAGIRTYKQLLPQNPEIADPLNKAIETVISGYKGRKSELFDQFARVYASFFTMEELQQIVDFYSSPTGQKLAKSNAATSGTINRIMDVFTSNLNTEFFAAVRAELKAKGIDT